MPRKASRAPFYSQVAQSWCVPLSNAVIALVDEDIANSLGWNAWSATSCGSQWRAIRRPWINREYLTIYMHREIMSAEDGFDVDHKIHPPHQERLIDNRRSNLRICEHVLNQRNTRLGRNNTSGFKGVTWDASQGKWAAALMLNYKRIALGRFDDKIAAARAYDAAAIELHGEYALTNANLGLLP